MITVATLFAPLLRVIDTVPDGDFYLQAVAVDPALRGEGVGTLLIDWIEEHALCSGSARLTLDVAGSNEGAQRLYERRGMTVESRWPRRFALPGLKLLRMTKELDAACTIVRDGRSTACGDAT